MKIYVNKHSKRAPGIAESAEVGRILNERLPQVHMV